MERCGSTSLFYCRPNHSDVETIARKNASRSQAHKSDFTHLPFASRAEEWQAIAVLEAVSEFQHEPMKIQRRQFVLAGWLWWLCVATVYALDPTKAITQYVHDVWTNKNGLPQNSILCMTQTRDGYLWFGTYEGLVRFDGVRFTVFDKINTKVLPSRWITTLVEDQEGGLWIGTDRGGCSARCLPRTFPLAVAVAAAVVAEVAALAAELAAPGVATSDRASSRS